MIKLPTGHTYWTHTVVVTAEVRVESQNFDPSDAEIQALVVESVENKQPQWDTECTHAVRDTHYNG